MGRGHICSDRRFVRFRHLRFRAICLHPVQKTIARGGLCGPTTITGIAPFQEFRPDRCGVGVGMIGRGDECGNHHDHDRGRSQGHVHLWVAPPGLRRLRRRSRVIGLQCLYAGISIDVGIGRCDRRLRSRPPLRWIPPAVGGLPPSLLRSRSSVRRVPFAVRGFPPALALRNVTHLIPSLRRQGPVPDRVHYKMMIPATCLRRIRNPIVAGLVHAG